MNNTVRNNLAGMFLFLWLNVWGIVDNEQKELTWSDEAAEEVWEDDERVLDDEAVQGPAGGHGHGGEDEVEGETLRGPCPDNRDHRGQGRRAVQHGHATGEQTWWVSGHHVLLGQHKYLSPSGDGADLF